MSDKFRAQRIRQRKAEAQSARQVRMIREAFTVQFSPTGALQVKPDQS